MDIQSSWFKLPTEIWVLVFKELDWTALRQTVLVDRKMRDLYRGGKELIVKAILSSEFLGKLESTDMPAIPRNRECVVWLNVRLAKLQLSYLMIDILKEGVRKLVQGRSCPIELLESLQLKFREQHRVDELIVFLSEVMSSQSRKGSVWTDKTLEMLCSELEAQERTEELIDTMKKVVRKEVEIGPGINWVDRLARKLKAQGRTEELINILKEMVRKVTDYGSYMDQLSLSQLTIELKAQRRTPELIDLLKEMILAQSISGPFLNVVFNYLKSELEEQGRTDELISLLEEAVRKKVESGRSCILRCLHKLATELDAHHRGQDLINILKEVVGKRLESAACILSSLQRLNLALEAQGRGDDLVEILEEMVREQLERPERGSLIQDSLHKLQLELKAKGQPEKLIDILEEIVRRQLAPPEHGSFIQDSLHRLQLEPVAPNTIDREHLRIETKCGSRAAHLMWKTFPVSPKGGGKKNSSLPKLTVAYHRINAYHAHLTRPTPQPGPETLERQLWRCWFCQRLTAFRARSCEEHDLSWESQRPE
ncbi:hypothetical protein LTR47_011705 [Exophiala xenobiotica]|nr:hypothetical protein LTR47_011705 [Exophiala xenobiotica]KAK5243105.1 hypothetical protein LTS06_011056 [Exophiala xenobiotica]KAK5357196.1 hypothetical protein LTS03_011685 [Exophiala xenobiotica]